MASASQQNLFEYVSVDFEGNNVQNHAFSVNNSNQNMEMKSIQINNTGFLVYANPIDNNISKVICAKVTVSTNNEEVIPLENKQMIVYPNPFNPETTISYSLKHSGMIDMAIYNIRGQKVATLFNGFKSEGDHQLTWKGMDDQGKSVPSGIYFCKLTHGSKSITKKISLIK